jgi:hypothetical protein
MPEVPPGTADHGADDADQKIDQKVLLAPHDIRGDDAGDQAYDQKIDQAHGVVLPVASTPYSLRLLKAAEPGTDSPIIADIGARGKMRMPGADARLG